MSKQSKALHTESVKSAGAISAYRGVTFANAQAVAGEKILGISNYAASAAGEMIAVDAIGTTIAESGGVFVRGDYLEMDAQGRVIVQSAGVVIGQALQASTAAGEFPEILIR